MAFIQMQNITKNFGGVAALKKVNFEIERGEIRALMGENGAGKSTLMKILTGNLEKDSGKIFIDKKEVEFKGVKSAVKYGIGMVHQELNIIPNMSVMENIWLNRELVNKFGVVDFKIMREETLTLLKKMNIPIKHDEFPVNYSAAFKQLVEIAKAVSTNPNLLIMDEPTSSLSASEVKILFSVLKGLQKNGTTIIYISHRMDEIQEICDSITVLRNGEHINSVSLDDASTNDIVKMMIGKEVPSITEKETIKDAKTLLEVKNLAINSEINNISFSLKEGEILGLAGLIGSGRTEIAEVIYGMKKKIKGQILINNKEVFIHHPSDAIKNKVALIHEDRNTTGVFLRLSILINVTISNIKGCMDSFIINDKKEKEVVAEYQNKLNIKMADAKNSVSSLSGGNQQKVSIAKSLFANPDIIIFDEPTRGVDVNSKTEICNIIIEYAKQGKGIIFISSELQEVLNVCDRILVLKQGKIKKEFSNKKEFSYQEILEECIS